MIPLKDLNPRSTVPVVNLFLIAVNIFCFFWETSLGDSLQRAITILGVIPARFAYPELIIGNLVTIFAAMFLHAGWLHLGGNMLYLWIFGDNVEDRLGHFRYLVFYLACGFIAAMTHVVMNPTSALPSLGASGAIAGVLGAYLVMFPRARVVTLIPIFFYPLIRELPAVLVLGLWFVLQLFVGVASLGVETAQQMGGVAYFAHIGGFVAGIVLVALFRKPRR